VGLALELLTSANANLAVSNKMFSYLMAGLAVIATDTFGQKDIMECIPSAGRICRMKDVAELASAMQFYIDQPEELLKARHAAAKAADEVYNWENESEKLLNNLRVHLS
jgi:glycosyltransferase involved in cell wall biosynthesis